MGVGVFDQRGGGAGGVLTGNRFNVFGGVGRGALTKLLLDPPEDRGFSPAATAVIFRLSTMTNELFALVGDITKLCAALQFV